MCRLTDIIFIASWSIVSYHACKTHWPSHVCEFHYSTVQICGNGSCRHHKIVSCGLDDICLYCVGHLFVLCKWVLGPVRNVLKIEHLLWPYGGTFLFLEIQMHLFVQVLYHSKNSNILVLTRSEWVVNQHRDSLASYIGHHNLMEFFAIAENESKARVKFNFLQVKFPLASYYY